MDQIVKVEPDGSDGLSLVQRAIIRHMFRSRGRVRCSSLTELLITHPDCPTEVTPEAIDLTIMLLACPFLARSPLLDYAGAGYDNDGWLPAPVYRMVSLGPPARGLIEFSTDDSPWSPAPLDIRVPYALLGGSHTWAVETESGFKDHERSQAPRRFRCIAVHLLCHELADIAAAVEHRHRLGSPNAACSCLEGNGVAPQGLTMGVTAGASGAYVMTGPVLVQFICSVEGSWETLHILKEPACGRHMGEQLDHLGAIVIDHDRLTLPIHDQANITGTRNRRFEGPIVRLPSTTNPSAWYHQVPYEPIGIDDQMRMLEACRL